MIRLCKNCGDKVTYDISLDALSCSACGSLFTLDEYSDDTDDYQEDDIDNYASDNEDEYFHKLNDEMIDCSIYSCSSCGGEISITKTEVSTFCIYCGNPSIVFSRLSQMRKPEAIIPFKVTRETAMNSFYERINKSEFVPKNFKDCKIDMMRGIYIPYYITNVEYDGSMILSCQESNGDGNVRTVYYKRSAYASMPWITTDASFTLNDEISQRIEPFDINEAVPFDEGYLIGFYSDIADVPVKDAIKVAKSRACEIAQDNLLNALSGSNKTVVKKRETAEVYERPVTALFPAWFLTIRYDNQPYTFIVNGQTGKLIGGVPWEKKPFVLNTIKYTAILCPILMGLTLLIYPPLLRSIRMTSSNDFKLLMLLYLIPITTMLASYATAKNNLKKIRESVYRTKSTVLTRYVGKRQKGS